MIPKEDIDPKHVITKGYKEKKLHKNIDKQNLRTLISTDEHLKHITGLLKDQNGTTYYKVKNS